MRLRGKITFTFGIGDREMKNRASWATRLARSRSPIINPRRACAARVTVVVLCVCVCVCVFVCPGRSSATHATKRQTGHTYGLSILLAPERIWRFSYNGLVSKIASYSVPILTTAP